MNTSVPGGFWCCFPWDSNAGSGQPFSPLYLHPGQTAGRFDLQDRPPLRYLASSPVHAVAEILQGFRGTTLSAAHLRRHGLPLALVELTAPDAILTRIADLGDPAVLLLLSRRPEELAHHDRTITQSIARQVHAAGYAGLQWWSALTGAWRTTVLFTDIAPNAILTVAQPEVLTVTSAPVVETARLLGIGLP